MRKRDLDKLENTNALLRSVIVEADREMPLKVLSVYRSPEEQFELYKKGRKLNEQGEWYIESKRQVVTYKDGFVKKSKHNYFPSQAVDVVPNDDQFPDGKFDWNNIDIFDKMCYVIERAAKRLNVKIRQGKTWKDYPHQEIIL